MKIVFFASLFMSIFVLSAEIVDEQLPEFRNCAKGVAGQIYSHTLSRDIKESDEHFHIRYRYLGEENESERYEGIVVVNNNFTYSLGTFSGCNIENELSYVWVTKKQDTYEITWRVSHTGAAVPEDYRGVVLSSEGEYISKLDREP